MGKSGYLDNPDDHLDTGEPSVDWWPRDRLWVWRRV
jgi:hypothetical protein